MRVAFLSRGLTNPLATLWPLALREMGHDVVHVDFESPGGGHGGDGSTDDSRVVLAAAGPLATPAAGAAAAALGGPPEIGFAWWGTGSVEYGSWAKAAWPAMKTVLCVDTFPNASIPATELREVLRLRRSAPEIDGLVYFSENMRRLHQSRSPALRARPSVVLPQPLPATSFARDVGSLSPGHRLPGSDRPRVVFTGRPDHLFTRDRRMRKDAVGPILESVRRGGAEVWIPSFRRPPDGWHTYPSFTTQQVVDGTFATYLGQFDAQLAVYREANATVRRRVTTGLASRFGLAVASPSTIVVPDRSHFARAVVETLDLGFALGDPGRLASRLDGERRARTNAAWDLHHPQFGAASSAEAMGLLFGEVAAG